MKDTPALSENIPNLWPIVDELCAELAADTYNDWDSLYQRLDFLTESKWIDEMDRVLLGWEKIATQSEGLTAKHTLVVLACCMNLPEYQNAESQTQCEIEWAAIYHDLDKDVIYGRGDGSHGVRSAGVSAQCMSKLGFDFQLNEGFEGWVNLVKSSQKQIEERWVNDFSYLADIMSGLHYFFGFDSPASRIFKAVMFHQAVSTVADWPNPVILAEDEMRSYLTLSDIDVLGPLLLGDSDAWNICEPTRLAYMNEIRGNIEKVKNIL